MAGIFKAYDVRGVYGSALNEEIAEKIGRAFANMIGAGKTIVCGRDGRPHSVPLRDALTLGLREGGMHVVDMGLCTPPMTYYAGFTHGFDASVMVTASHNAGEYNGFKFCRENAIPVGYDDGLNEVERRVHAQQLPAAHTVGQFSHDQFKEGYLSYLQDHLKANKKFQFAVDCGNGMGGYLIGDLLERIGQSAEALYCDLDCSFPNHLANPLDFNTLRDLCQTVKNKGLDFGVAFDGDADRCFFVDDQGEVVPADILTTLIAEDFLIERGPSAIIYDVRSSRVVREVIESHGGTPVMCRVGHSYMKSMLRKHGGWFGGELAGHFYFRDFSYADSAMLTMITVMNILDKHGKSLSELIAPYKKYVPSGEINYVTEKADALIAMAQERYAKGEKLTIDGLRIDFPDWWFCLRKSNTEPLLRLVIEAKTKSRLDEVRGELCGWLEAEGAHTHHH